MNEIERYHFDLNGYLVVKNLLSAEEVSRYLAAADDLEDHFTKTVDDAPRLVGFSNVSYRFDRQHQCFSYKSLSGGGLQVVVDDFLNASPAFDGLVGHARTMSYVDELCVGPNWIGSSELRYRYKSNETHTHMGGRMDMRNRYEYAGVKMYDSAAQVWRVRDFDLAAVRVLYALHDTPEDYGPLCVVPGSHKSNYFSPFPDQKPTAEPGMIPVPLNAGDAILFTENLRHGGFPNLRDRARRTVHLMFSPRWVGSQSPIHWNENVYVSREAWGRYSAAQRAVLPAPAPEYEQEAKILRQENERLKSEITDLKTQLAAQQLPEAPASEPKRPPASIFRRVMGR